MSLPTLAEWNALDDDVRTVVVDQLLEKIPDGYVDPRSVGHRNPTPLPQFIHRETGVLFHVVFGGPAVIGMTEKRFDRLRRITIDDDEDGLVPVVELDEARELLPPREVSVAPALVADQVLPFGVIARLGVDPARITVNAVKVHGIGPLLRALTPLGWRAPSEAEWEYACRAVDDDVLDLEPPVRATGRLGVTGLRQMGMWAELCRDSWHDDLAELPAQGPAGLGHEVLRGRGSGARFAGLHGSPAWNEALWPGRRRQASWPNAVSLRPWVELKG
ncbi:MAG: hypothetical protein U0228_29220 [Myxococcaceae bacterium]